MEKSSRIVEDHQLLVLVTLPKEPSDLVWYRSDLLPWSDDPFIYWLGLEDSSGRLLHRAITNLIDVPILQAGNSAHAILTPLSESHWVHLKRGDFIVIQHRTEWIVEIVEPIADRYTLEHSSKKGNKKRDQN